MRREAAPTGWLGHRSPGHGCPRGGVADSAICTNPSKSLQILRVAIVFNINHLHFLLKKVYLVERQSYTHTHTDRDREIDIFQPLILKWPHWLGLGQAEAKNPALHWVSHVGT